jgi:DNA modification methylase
MNASILNKVICGDCRILIKDIESHSIDLIITDFPYCTTKEKWDQENIVTDDLVQELYRILKESGSIYIWCGIGEKSQSLISWFPLFNEYFYFKDLITWKKQRGIGMRRGWLYTREEIMWFVVNNKQFIWNKQYSAETYDAAWAKRLNKVKFPYKRASNVWTDIKEETLSNACGIPKHSKKLWDHFTPKPVSAITRLILAHTSENDIVFDPTIGSGTTAVAALQNKRNFIGFEISPEFCDVCQQRVGAPGIF